MRLDFQIQIKYMGACLEVLRNLRCCCSSPCIQKYHNNPRANSNQSMIELQFNQSSININPEQNLIISNISLRKKLEALFTKQKKWQLINGSSIYDDRTCSICLADRANIKLQCKHYFHMPCLLIWYKSKNSCPNCRCKINNLNIFCQTCDYQYYTTIFADAMKEKTTDQLGLPILNVCEICKNTKKKTAQ